MAKKQLTEILRNDIEAYIASNKELMFNERDLQVRIATALRDSRHYDDVDMEYAVPLNELTKRKLNIEAGKYETRISNAPIQEKELISISRQQEIKANLYLMLLQKREENAITLASVANNGRIIEEPLYGGQTGPKSKQIYMIAFVLGIAFPVGCLWLIRMLRFRIEGRADVERITREILAAVLAKK